MVQKAATISSSDRAGRDLPRAWLPLTFQGVAAFAMDRWRRTLWMLLVFSQLTGGILFWSLWAGWVPIVEQAIDQLPDACTLKNGRLLWPEGAGPRVLGENRLIGFQLGRPDAQAISDLRVELGERRLEVCSWLGCLRAGYPMHWQIPLNRLDTRAAWEAWKGAAFLLGWLSITLLLGLSWLLLAGLYATAVRLLLLFADREGNFGSALRLSLAALMPGALVVAASVLLYLFGWVDLLGLALLHLLHLVVGWIYLAGSIRCLPRLSSSAAPPSSANPFRPA